MHQAWIETEGGRQRGVFGTKLLDRTVAAQQGRQRSRGGPAVHHVPGDRQVLGTGEAYVEQTELLVACLLPGDGGQLVSTAGAGADVQYSPTGCIQIGEGAAQVYLRDAHLR